MNRVLDIALTKFGNKEALEAIDAIKENSSLKNHRTLYAIDDLIYWFYIIDDRDMALEVASSIDKIQFKGDFVVWERVASALAIESVIYSERNEKEKAAKCIDAIKARFNTGDESIDKMRLRTLDRILDGSLLNDDKIKTAQERNDLDAEIAWRFSQFKRLVYMKVLGSGLLDAEIAKEKKFLKERVILSLPEGAVNRHIKQKEKLQISLIEQYWAEIESHLQKQGIALDIILQPGATNAQIDWAQAMLGVKLPDNFIEFYKVHNGQKPYTQGIVDGEELLSLERIVQEWMIWEKQFLDTAFHNLIANSDEGVEDVWFNLGWIPFTSDGSGNHLCIDLAPTSQGYLGQVIRILDNDGGRFKEAPTFITWVANFAST